MNHLPTGVTTLTQSERMEPSAEATTRQRSRPWRWKIQQRSLARIPVKGADD